MKSSEPKHTVLLLACGWHCSEMGSVVHASALPSSHSLTPHSLPPCISSRRSFENRCAWIRSKPNNMLKYVAGHQSEERKLASYLSQYLGKEQHTPEKSNLAQSKPAHCAVVTGRPAKENDPSGQRKEGPRPTLIRACLHSPVRPSMPPTH